MRSAPVARVSNQVQRKPERQVEGADRVRDQAGELRKREDEDQIEEQLDGADPLYIR